METSSISPSTQRSLINATSLEKSTEASPTVKADFNKSSKKIDKIVRKINSKNAENTDHQTTERSGKSNNIKRQVIYLDSTNSLQLENVKGPPQTKQAPKHDFTKDIQDIQAESTNTK